MNLTEDQLFTIEALNRVDGFVWPEKASNAWVNKDKSFVCFTVLGGSRVLSIKECRVYNGIYAKGVSESSQHPDWRNSLITREQFDSVDGWVRHNNSECPANSELQVQVKMHGFLGYSPSYPHIAKAWPWVNGGITHWRYHKPTKETDMQPEAPKQPSIDDLYLQYKTQRGIVESAKKVLADEMEAEDKLLEQIRAWNLEYGFDVRLLDESEENPELVITDWRDLRLGDVVEIIGSDNPAWRRFSGEEVSVSKIGERESDILLESSRNGVWWIRHETRWKFIRRP
ncbi:MAG: hypothetical protein ACRDAL_02480 [Plesiomonas shigelloides]